MNTPSRELFSDPDKQRLMDLSIKTFAAGLARDFPELRENPGKLKRYVGRKVMRGLPKGSPGKKGSPEVR